MIPQLVPLIATFFLTAEPNEDAIKKELEKLQGTWTIVSFHDEDRPDVRAKGMKFKITGNTIVFFGQENTKATIKLDLSKKPREIDFVVKNEKNAKDIDTKPGIYELDGDNLKICMGSHKDLEYRDQTGKITKKESIRGKRPTKFGGKETDLIVLKRGDIVVKSDEEKYKKLIVGKWKASSISPSFIWTETEFTADGKIKYLEKAEGEKEPSWKEVGTYVIEGDYIIAKRLHPKNKSGKTEAVWKTEIEKLTETEFVIQYAKMTRLK